MTTLDLIPTSEAAEILRVSTKTVQRWADAGRLPIAMQAPGLRGSRFFLRSQVEHLATELGSTPAAQRDSAAAS